MLVTEGSNIIRFPDRSPFKEIEAAIFDCGHSVVWLMVDGTVGCVECDGTPVEGITWSTGDDDLPDIS